MAQVVNLPESWYEATAIRGAVQQIESSQKADVCIIGGGLAGLTTALELARRKKSVVLLEASQVACGASGRNGGFVSNGFALGIGDVAHLVGAEAARQLYQMSHEGKEFVRNTILQNDPSIFCGEGLRVCVRYNDRGGLHRYAEELRNTYAENVVAEDAVLTRSKLNTQRYFDSIVFPEAFHIHPLRYALLLKELCMEAGVKIFEQSPALSVSRSGQDFLVTCAKGQVRSQHVVHCVSSLDRNIHAATGRAVLPVATYVAVTEPQAQDAILTTEAVADTRRAGDYYRLVDGQRILWGGRITTQVREPHALAEAMRGDMAATFPQLGGVRISHAWAGLMAYALHKMPLIGRDQEGQWFATAFGGHGLNTTAMAGQVLARAIIGGDDSYRRFSPFAPRWAFGQLGRFGVQGSYWWMQAKDRMNEATKTAIER